MPLIHAIEVANFMNYQRTLPWTPDWRHARFLLKGLHTAINIPNGRGKSTVIHTILSMLVWDTKSLKKTKRTHWAPLSSPAFTHVRIEITNRNHVQAGLFAAIADPTDGDHMVFGVYGNACDENPEFYAYHGTFDDCPVATVTPDRTTLLSKEEFLEGLGRLKTTHSLFPSHPRDRQGGEWKRYVSDFFDMSSIHQQHKYQLANGAEGSAKYFDVDKEGANYSAELFYKHLAPELLSELMGGYGEDDEHGIEDTIHEKARGVVQARRETDQKASELVGALRVLTMLERLDKIRVTIAARTDEVSAAQTKLAVEYFALEHALVQRQMPGVPLPPAPGLPAFYGDFVLQDGQWWLSDRGLSIFSGDDAKRVNERAWRNPVVRSVEVKISQVLDFKCDLSSGYTNSARPGWKPELFNRDACIAMLEKTVKFAHTWNREAALAAMDAAFAWIASTGDSNPARAKSAVIEQQLRKDKEIRSQADLAHTDARLRADATNRDIRQLAGSATAWQSVIDSQLFTPDELGDLSTTADAVIKDAATTKLALGKHHQMVGERSSAHRELAAFAEVHGNVRPEDIAGRLQTDNAQDRSRLDATIAGLQKTRPETATSAALAQQASAAWESHESRVGRALELALLAQGYAPLFGERDPTGLEEIVVRDVKQARSARESANSTLKTLTGALNAIAAFDNAHPFVAPGDWLAARQIRKSACLEQVAVSTRYLQSASSVRTRAQRLQSEATEFGSYYDDEAPGGLETAVRDALREGEAALNDHGRQLAQMKNALDALVDFQKSTGSADPTAWMAECLHRQAEANIVLQRDRPVLAEARSLRSALDDAPVAPGAIARDVASIAGTDSIALHDFVRQLRLGDARNASVLTLFSALLFSPVFTELAAAQAAAEALAREEIEAPVFLASALEQFCRSGAISFDGDSASGLLVGVRTRNVECLLDPRLIEREKQRLDKQIAALEKSCGAAQARLDELSSGMNIVPVATLAAQAVAEGYPRKAAELETAIARLQLELPRLQRRAGDNAIATIRAALLLRAELGLDADASVVSVDTALERLGHRCRTFSDEVSQAQVELAQLREEDALEHTAAAADVAIVNCAPGKAAAARIAIAQGDDELPRLETLASPDAVEAIRAAIRLATFLNGQNIDDLEAQRAPLANAKAAAASEHEHLLALCMQLEREKELAEAACRRSEEAALEVPRMRALQSYVDDTEYGPAFMAGHESEGNRLNTAMMLAQQRAGFNFSNAQAFVRGGGATRLQALQDQHAALLAKMESLDALIKEKERAIDDAYPTLQPLQRAASQIDAAVHNLYQRWHKIAGVLSAPPAVPSEQIEQHVLWIGVTKWRAMSSPDDIASEMSHVCDMLATADDASTVDVLRNAIGALKRANDSLCAEIDRALTDVSVKLPETARVKLEQSKTSPGQLAEMLAAGKASYAKNDEANRIATDHLKQERAGLSEWLATFTLRLPDNLATLRSVFSANHGGQAGHSRAGFDIEATVIGSDGIGLLIEKIIRSVEELENGQLASAGSNEKLRKHIHKTLRESIRDTFYREVILNPRIRLVLPSISGRALEMKRDMASSGQGVAITFLWILKLAEFINEREVRRQTVDGARRRRVRDKASAFTMLDGAFSHLSDKGLINETLAGIENSLGRFQLIITGHDPAYENDFKRFPALVVAREMSGHYMRATSHHHASRDDARDGSMESFHAIYVQRPAPIEKPVAQ